MKLENQWNGRVDCVKCFSSSSTCYYENLDQEWSSSLEAEIMFMFTLATLPENSPKTQNQNLIIYHANRHSAPQITCCWWTSPFAKKQKINILEHWRDVNSTQIFACLKEKKREDKGSGHVYTDTSPPSKQLFLDE